MTTLAFAPATAAVYVWQMNDGRWHVSAVFHCPAQELETNLALWRAGLDRGFESRADADAALARWRQS